MAASKFDVIAFIGGWCNGSTGDSGSPSLGSNPSPPVFSFHQKDLKGALVTNITDVMFVSAGGLPVASKTSERSQILVPQP